MDVGDEQFRDDRRQDAVLRAPGHDPSLSIGAVPGRLGERLTADVRVRGEQLDDQAGERIGSARAAPASGGAADRGYYR